MAVIKERYEDVVKQAISEFIEQALPDDPPVAPIVYDLVPGEPELLDATYVMAYATIYLDDGEVDLAIRVVQSSWQFDNEPVDAGCVDRIDATRDVREVNGEHFETLSWDQEALTWFCVDDPDNPLPDPTD